MHSQQRKMLISALEKKAYQIYHQENLNEMIMVHEMMLDTFYRRRPLFYKTLFKHHRFCISAIILAIFYNQRDATLKLVKERIMSGKKIVSATALDAFLVQLRISGRLEIFRNAENRRESIYRPTEKFITEAYELILCILKPYEILNGATQINYAHNPQDFIPAFFKRYIDFVLNDITIIDIIPRAEVFIEKDAGHMIMLIMYREYVRQQSLCIMLSNKSIARYAHVSRTHVRNVLLAAQDAGYLWQKSNLSIELTPEFISLFRMYFSIYMAKGLYAISDAEPTHYTETTNFLSKHPD